jgi:hypothetical protein
MSANALAAAQQLQRRSMETGRITEENRLARQQETQTRAAAQLSVTAWLTAELQKVAAAVSSESIVCEVRDAAVPDNFGIQTGTASMYRPLNGVELILDDQHDLMNRKHLLQFFLCGHRKVVFTNHSGADPKIPTPAPARDVELAIVPLYRQMLKHQNPGIAPSLGYINRPDQIGNTRGRLHLPAQGMRVSRGSVQYHRVQRIAHTFESDVAVHAAFRVSEWPANEEVIREMLQQALDGFFAHVSE